LEHCRRLGDRFALLDTPMAGSAAEARTDPAKSAIRKAVEHWEALPPSHGALYFPWLHVKPDEHFRDAALGARETGHPQKSNVEARGEETSCLVPPCGHIAGVYARSDARVGVHKAPANEIVEDAVDLQFEVHDEEHTMLNEAGVNCLRTMAGRGIRVWGARTLSGQAEWRYVNVRRLFLTLARWVERNTSDFVFEPHNPLLWDRIRQRLSSYCRELFDRGALMGRTPEEAYFVKCDAETNPLATREAGCVVIEIGLAAIVPAEFVVVRITQRAGIATVTEPSGSQ
jgi:phage tail sheath protein FI